MRTWHKTEAGGLESRLHCLRLFPDFFNPVESSTTFSKVDISELLEALREVTTDNDTWWSSLQSGETGENSLNPTWRFGGPTKLFVIAVNLHCISMRTEEGGCPRVSHREKKEELLSSWPSVMASSHLYLHSVVYLWNRGEPMEARLLQRFVEIIERDAATSPDLVPGTISESLWLWKAFVGAMGLLQAKEYKTESAPATKLKLQHIETTLIGHLKYWSIVRDRSRWRDVYSSLVRIAWPTCSCLNIKAKMFWETILEQAGEK